MVKIYVAVTDRSDDISYASGYAFHPIGGILRDVRIIALPENYIARLSTEIEFDKLYEDAMLKLNLSACIHDQAGLLIVKMYDPKSRELKLEHCEIKLTKQNSDNLTVCFPVNIKWDAEHPFLYRIEIELWMNGKLQKIVDRNIGFRKIPPIG